MAWYLPLGQWKQLFLRVQALYLPVPHRWQVLPVDGWYLPVGQSLHLMDLATEYLPFLHTVHEGAL